MISATRKTGFLIEDGTKMGSIIGCLRAYAAFVHDSQMRDLADSLDSLRAQTYYEPAPLVEQIAEVA